SITCSWPTMSLRSSAWMRSAPSFIRSASRMSSSSWSPESSITVAKTAPVPYVCIGSVRECVDHVVHGELVRIVRQVDRVEPGRAVLHELADVVVDVHDRELPLRRVVVLEQAPVRGTAAAIALVDRERGQVDVEERPEDRLVARQHDRLQLRQHAPHLLEQIVCLVPTEIIEDD